MHIWYSGTRSSFQSIEQRVLNAQQSLTVDHKHDTATQSPQLQDTKTNYSAGPSSQFLLVTSTGSNHIKKINLPIKNVAVGRPKGSQKTVIGLKRKINDGENKKLIFAEQSESIQAFRILGWLTNLNVDEILKKKISYNDILQDSYMFQRLLNKHIVLRVIKKYCDSKCYLYLTQEVKRLQGLKRLLCRKCKRMANQNALHCEGCLDYFHLKCTGMAGIKKKPNQFFCMECE